MNDNYRGVTTLQRLNGVSTLRNSNNEIVDIEKSRTCGLQEAINCSAETQTNLEVIGGQNEMFICGTSIIVPPLKNNTYWHIGNGKIRFTFGGDQDGLIFDSWIHTQIICEAEIIYYGSGSVISFSPRSGFDGYPAMGTDSRFYFFRINTEGKGSIGVYFDTTNVSIIHNKFDLMEIEGRAGQECYMKTGVMVRKPMYGNRFEGNEFSIQRLQGFSEYGICVGDDHYKDEDGYLRDNRYSARIAPMSKEAIGFATCEKGGYGVLHISDEIMPMKEAIHFFKKAKNNYIIAPHLGGKVGGPRQNKVVS
jgi:hypothetical protein